jgi:membrane fusion protein (multidrug efflux system)
VQSAAGNIETAKVRLGRATNDLIVTKIYTKSYHSTKQIRARNLRQNKTEEVRILQQQEKQLLSNVSNQG